VKALVDGVREGQVPGRPAFPALPERPHQSGSFGELDAALALLRHQMVDAMAQAAAVDGEVPELEVFAEIAQRLHGRATRVLRAGSAQAESPSVVSGWRRVPLLRVVTGCRGTGGSAGQPRFGRSASRSRAGVILPAQGQC
jgi:hypothetical protein